jgi:hypothetical protein
MHKKANEERHHHARNRARRNNRPSLPWNKRELTERQLVLGIDESAASSESVSWAAGLSFILFCQVDSSSPVLSWLIMKSGLIPLAWSNRRSTAAQNYVHIASYATSEQSFAILT